MIDYKLNIASFVQQTRALGPGIRAGLWVQGCPFRCPGCIVPEWQVTKDNHLVPVNEIVESIIRNPAVSGLTISGGEPISQAKSLVNLIKQIKADKDINIISFSGFTLGQLINRMSLYPEIGQYLDLIDVLIDGPYVKKLDDNKGLRGSSNQVVHHLSGRLSYFDFHNSPREVEFFIQQNQITMAGIPPHGLLNILDQIEQQPAKAQGILKGMIYEW